MTAICKMTGKETELPCSASGCPLFGDCLVEYENAAKKPKINADRMSMMLRENDANGLLDWWQEIFEDGVPSEDYFKWWLKQPAERGGMSNEMGFRSH